MKSFENLNYYEILNIPVNSTLIEIRRAYRDALSIYEEDALVTYSLFSDKERMHLMKTIEDAFYTLIDDNKRVAYNRILIDTGQIDASAFSTRDERKPISFFRTKPASTTDDIALRISKNSKEEEVISLVNEILAKDLITGADLKRLREAFGIKISEIHLTTRISISVLNMIEIDQCDSLPADVYLKFFLRSYAELLRIDSQRIVAGYLKNKLLSRQED